MGMKKSILSKTFFLLFGILPAALFLLGMGQLGPANKAGEIPLPEQEVTVQLTDVQGFSLTLTQFSINGQTFLQGRLGAGRLSIPFHRIQSITFAAATKGVWARIETTDRSTVELLLDKGGTAYGRIKPGTYQIPLEQVRQITVQTVSDRKKDD